MHAGMVIGFVGGLIFLAHLFAVIANRTRIVDGVFLIGIGLLLGPGLHLVEPADFGKVGPVFTAVALVLILFEGGLEVRLESLRKAIPGTTRLCLLSFASSLAVVAMGAHWIGQMEWLPAFTMGAMVGGTSPVVIIPLVRQLKMHQDARAVLSLEAAVSDVFAIVVSLALLDAQLQGRLRVAHLIGNIPVAFLVALAAGSLSGLLWSMLLKRMRTLQNAIFTTPALLFIVYGGLEWLGYPGAIAALAFGIVLGNADDFRLPLVRRGVALEPLTLNETEKVVFSEIGFLLKTFFFVYIGLSITLSDDWLLFIALSLVLLLVLVRPLVARFSIGRETPVREASMIAVVIPRGLAAAALASLPISDGLPQGHWMQTVAYGVILFSILASSLLAFLVDRTPLGRLYGLFFRGYGGRPALAQAVPESGGESMPEEWL